MSSDSNIRKDVLVTGPLLPYTGSGATSSAWNSGTKNDGDLFCLGGFNWETDINAQTPTALQFDNKYDPGVCLMLGNSNLLTLGSKEVSMVVGAGGAVTITPSDYINEVLLSRKWASSQSNASVSINVNGVDAPYTRIFFKWVHPSTLCNNIVDVSDSSIGNRWYYTLAFSAAAGGLVSVTGCKKSGSGYNSSSDLIATNCNGKSVMGFGSESITTYAKHVKDGFLLKAYYYSTSAAGIIPAEVYTFNNGVENSTSGNYLYLHYHRIYSESNTPNNGPDYTSSGYLELLPIKELLSSNCKTNPELADTWAIDGGFLFDKGNFQFDWDDGTDGLPSWNVYHDPSRLIQAALPTDTATLQPFVLDVKPVTSSTGPYVPLNFMAMPYSWYYPPSSGSKGIQWYNQQNSIERQQCYRFYVNNPITNYSTQCAAIGLTEDYENYRGNTQSNIATQTQMKTYYTSNNGCATTPSSSNIYNTIPNSSGVFEPASIGYTYYNSFSGYCSYESGQDNFVNSKSFPLPNCGYDGNCSGCTTTSCGTTLCDTLINDSACKDTLCSRAASICGSSEGDPNWGSSSMSLVFIIILILAIFGMAIYFVYDKKQHNTKVENGEIIEKPTKKNK
jgi:hypothetical protein